MAKRRQRGLGSSVEEHTTRARALDVSTRVHARDSERAARKGNCTEALQRLEIANRNYGSTIEAHHGAGWKRRLSEVTVRTMERANATFKRVCLVR